MESLNATRANEGSSSNEYAQYARSGLKFLLTMAICLIPLILCVLGLAWFSRGKAGFFSAIWDSTSDIKGLIGIWLAVSGIVYAFTHAYELEKQTEELRWLQRSLSTRRLTQFPMYLTQIQKLAKASKRDAKKTVRVMPWAADRRARTAMHLDILADCLDYGSFFSPDFHAAVHKALCRAAYAPGVQVRILVCGPMPEPFTGPSGQKLNDYSNHDQILSNYRSFLLEDSGFTNWLQRLQTSDSRWKEIARSWFFSLLEDADPMPSWDDLLTKYSYDQMVDNTEKPLKQLLQIRQLWFAKDLQRVHVQIAGLPERQPLFLWVKYRYDDQRKRDTRDAALFTFANSRAGEGQLGFTTRDHDLLNTFRAMFDERWEAAQKEEPDWLRVLKGIDTFGEPASPDLTVPGLGATAG